MRVGKENQSTNEFLNTLSYDRPTSSEKPFSSLWRKVMDESPALRNGKFMHLL